MFGKDNATVLVTVSELKGAAKAYQYQPSTHLDGVAAGHFGGKG